MKSRTIISSTNEGNIPVLVVGNYIQPTNGYITFTFNEKTQGIFAPFSGIFLLKFNSIPSSGSSRVSVKIDNIYGEAKVLYKGSGNSYSEVGLGELNVGVYLCYFDTDDRRLHLVQ